MTPERTQRFKEIASIRQSNLTIILENVHDQHNIGAVLRTADSVGIKEIFVLYSEPELSVKNIVLGQKTSSGARKWVDVHFYTDLEACFKHVRENYEVILSTHLDEKPRSIYELDLTQSVALLFGNEHDGVSEAALNHSDGNFIIPQVGMVKSLNISVACAVTLYEAFRQRQEKGFYDENKPMSIEEQEALYEEYERRHVSKATRKKVFNQDWEENVDK
jgi:tRNA (guanosine-2'-O-)-methyltransferase